MRASRHESGQRPRGGPLARTGTMVRAMRYAFLSDGWFQKVDELIVAAGDLQIPAPMRAVQVNVTVTSPTGATELFMKDGLFSRGHRPGAEASLTLSSDLARKIFVEGDAAAGVQAFLTGEIQ